MFRTAVLFAAPALAVADVALTRKEYADIFIGVGKGFGLQLLDQCIVDSMEFGEDCEKAIKDMETKTEQGVKDGLMELATSMVTILPNAARHCEGTEKEVQSIVKALASFTNPYSFAYHVGQDLLVNGIDIFKNVNAAISEWHSKDYEPFGEHLGKALKDVVIGSKKLDAKHALKTKTIKPEDSISLVKGIVEGFGGKVEDGCITDSDLVAAHIEKIIALLNDGSAASKAEAMAIASEVLMSTLPAALKDCASAKDSVALILKQLASKYKTPADLAYHIGEDLIEHGEAIFKDVESGQANWEEEQFEAAGNNFGEAIGLALIGKIPTEGKFMAAANRESIFV